MNLVVNARDAMPQGGELTLQTANVDLDGNYAAAHPGVSPGPHVLLTVSDTGSGMSEATQARAFEPFFTTKEQGKGTGLGLSTVLGIVEQSGGSLALDSALDRGTTFRLYFPAASQAEVPGLVSAGRTEALGGETILLVEDEAAVRSLACTILSKSGYQVLEARDGEEALLLCERFPGPIHLVLTDVIMPKIAGPELAERLSRLRPQSRVLFMSGYTDDTVVHHGLLKSGLAFLQKPLTPDSLTRKVREVLDGPERARRAADLASPAQA
jgi:CheY-like chemotaxis protein